MTSIQMPARPVIQATTSLTAAPYALAVKIAVLCHSSAGGSGVVATELALALASLGHDIHVVATQLPFRLNQTRLPRLNPDPSGLERCGEVYFHQVETANYPLFEQPLTALATSNMLASVIEEHSIELIHAHYAIPHTTNALLARDMLAERHQVAVVTTLHGTDVTLVGLEPSFLRSTRFAIEQSNGVTAVSEHLADHTRSVMGIKREINVVYNWVDPDRFRPIVDPSYRARFAYPHEVILFHASNFRPVKRPQDVVEVFARVLHERPARLLFVGDGPERQRCADLARQLGVEHHVHFLGSLPAIETVLGVADVLLLPSSQESFGLVALEAMACGAVVVSSDAGGLPEVVGGSGFLSPIGDVAQMTENVLKALENRQQLGQLARERAIECFRPGVVLPGYLQVYQKALDR
jgi:L-malate glycosyltransferase